MSDDLVPPPTEMICYECSECEMTAICVVTPDAAVAWLEHMESHGPFALYNAWAWTVVPLRFQPVED